jgi:hypothetical protein
MQEGHSNSTVGVGHRHFLVVLASSKQLLPRVNTLHLFLATNGSHDGLVQTERKLRLSVDGLMTASVLHLGPCAKNMVMFAITIALLCCSLFSGSSDACSCIRTNLRGSAGSPRIDAPLVDCITISDARPAWPDRLWIAE